MGGDWLKMVMARDEDKIHPATDITERTSTLLVYWYIAMAIIINKHKTQLTINNNPICRARIT